MTSKGETWSDGTYSRLPLDINMMLNVSIVGRFYLWNIKMYEKTNPFLGTSFLFLWKNPNDPVFLI